MSVLCLVVHPQRGDRGRGNQPASSATNRASPIPTGATKVARDFSAARNKTVMTSSVVKNISMKSPCAMETLCDNVVCTANGPGNMQETKAAATIPPSIWAGSSKRPLTTGRVPLIIIPNVTCRSVGVSSSGSPPPLLSFSSERSHRGVEQPTADTVEDPSGDGERKAKGQTDEDQLIQGRLTGWSQGVGNLGGGKGKVQKHGGAGKLARHGDYMALGGGGSGLSVLPMVVVLAFNVGGMLSGVRSRRRSTLGAAKWIVHCGGRKLIPKRKQRGGKREIKKRARLGEGNSKEVVKLQKCRRKYPVPNHGVQGRLNPRDPDSNELTSSTDRNHFSPVGRRKKKSRMEEKARGRNFRL